MDRFYWLQELDARTNSLKTLLSHLESIDEWALPPNAEEVLRAIECIERLKPYWESTARRPSSYKGKGPRDYQGEISIREREIESLQNTIALLKGEKKLINGKLTEN